MIYLTIHQIKPKKLTILIKMVNEFLSSRTSSQIKQIKMTCLIKIINDFLVKLNMIC